MSESKQRPAEHVHSEDKTCSCGIVALEPDEYCPKHGGSRRWPPRCAECGQFITWKEANKQSPRCLKTQLGFATKESSGIAVCTLARHHEGEHQYVDGDNVQVSPLAQSPRVCVQCGHNNVSDSEKGTSIYGMCIEPVSDSSAIDWPKPKIACGCKCEFPASVPERVEFHACDYDYSDDGKCIICGLPKPASVPSAGEWIDEYQAAMKIAIHLSQNFYPEQSWVPEPTLMGVLTQIDNMVVGLHAAASQEEK